MTDRPIIFSAPMVQALLAGRKTQTRRLLNPQPNMLNGDRPMNDGRGSYSIGSGWKRFPYARGDRLYVREAHALVGTVDPQFILYRASGYEAECVRHGFDNPPPESEVRWRPSIHMPRWASRLTLTVTEVRVQRLQQITYGDTLAEGIEATDIHARRQRACLDGTGQCGSVCRDSFQELWSSLHGADAWDANPWVVAVSFTVRHGNIDAARVAPTNGDAPGEGE